MIKLRARGLLGRFASIFFACTVVAAMLTACGGDNDGGSDSTPPATSTPPAGTTPPDTTPPATTPPTPVTQQSIKHVFVLTMENKNFLDSFVQSAQDPDFQSIAQQGAVLREYYGTGHVSLDNYLAMMSGQPSTNDTESDCFQAWSDIVADGADAGNPKVIKAKADAHGRQGCVYPKEVQTFANQLDEIGVTWKGYMGDMGNDLDRDGTKTCSFPRRTAQLAASHGGPAFDASTVVDGTQSAEAPSVVVPLGDQYATRHNPFVYFHSIIDDLGYCDQHIVPLDDATLGLQQDLQKIETTPNFVFITPNLCDDGHDGIAANGSGTGCVDGRKGGLVGINDFVKKWVAIIQASPAYKQDGLIIINFDESDASSGGATTSVSGGITKFTVNLTGDSCCGQVSGPNVPRPDDQIIPLSPTQQYVLHYEGIGGDRTGAILLSKWIKPGTISDVAYNHYSMLKSLENIFQTKGYLGYADAKDLTPFGSDIFNNMN